MSSQRKTPARAEQAIATAEAAFGTIPPALLRQARRLRWLQAPQAAPPAGYDYPELIAHPVAYHQFPRSPTTTSART